MERSDMTQSEKVTAIAKILKKRFIDLSTDQTIDLAFEILNAVEKT